MRQTAVMPVVGFLHTASVHEGTFAGLVREADAAVTVVSVVDSSLLDRARRTGPDDRVVRADVRRRLIELSDAGCEQIICTCSTIGGIAEDIGRALGVTVMRVDRPMVEVAVELGGPILVLAALQSTLAPTLDLIDAVAGASGAGADLDVRAEVVDGAWARFEAGDLDGYRTLVVDAIERVDDEVGVIVLAQASMAAAAAIARTYIPVLVSPRLAVERVLS